MTSNLKKTNLYPIWGIISQLGNNIPLGELLTSAILSSGCPSFDLLDWLLSFSKPSNSSSSIKCSNSSSSVYNVKNIPMGEFSHRMLYQLFKYTHNKILRMKLINTTKTFPTKKQKIFNVKFLCYHYIASNSASRNYIFAILKRRITEYLNLIRKLQ